MLINNTIRVLSGIIGFLIIPAIPITTLILGILVKISFGLLLIPISIIWSILFYFPLLGLSYLYENVKIFRPIAAILGIPISICADIFISLMPSMGESDSKMAKILSAASFPYTFSLSVFNVPGRASYLLRDDRIKFIYTIFFREKENNVLMTHYIDNVLLIPKQINQN